MNTASRPRDEHRNQPPAPAASNHATTDPLRAYLAVLAPEADPSELLELRYRLTGRRMASRFYPADQPGRLIAAITRFAARSDVYIGCAPRTHRHGGRGAVARAHVLWADCDSPQAALRLAAFEPPPSMVISSGGPHGRHAYWALEHPIDAHAGEKANHRVARTLGADLACCDPSRILRPPGTWNYKYTPPAPVLLEGLEFTRRYALAEVVDGLPASPAMPRRAQRVLRDTSGDPLLEVAPDHYVRALLGADVPADRKVSCPFHRDTAPSLHVYPTAERGWYCFSCRRGGSIYDLAAGIWNVNPRDRDFLALRARLGQHMGVATSERANHGDGR